MTLIYDMIYFVFAFLFGLAASTLFAGISFERKNLYSLLAFCCFDGLLQLYFFLNYGEVFTRQIYPLITHVPLLLFLVFIYKCRILNALASILTAYLCCQIPHWCGLFFNSFFQHNAVYTFTYIMVACFTLYILYCYIAEIIHVFISQSKKHVLILGIIPLCYYIFDYISTVYTDLLFSGNEIVVQFMPSVSCILYLVFILYYHQKLAQQEQRQHEIDLLNLQLEHAANTLEQMRNIQTQTITYRHDMRHHCTLLQGLAATGDIEKINHYLNTLQADIESITPQKFCSNEFINLILSTYYTKASNKDIALDIKCTVPQTLSITDTQLCAILSNALENAIEATAQTTQRTIKVRLAIHNRALLIQIVNPYNGTITYNEKLPVSTQYNHGIGTKSIANIVSYYNGQYEFLSENQVFTLKVLLPLTDK